MLIYRSQNTLQRQVSATIISEPEPRRHRAVKWPAQVYKNKSMSESGRVPQPGVVAVGATSSSNLIYPIPK